MLDDHVAAEERHDRFVRRVVEGGEVWWLYDVENGPTAPSNEDEERGVVPFWSDRAYAAQCAREDWSRYGPESLALETFLEHVLPDLESQGMLVGTNWNAHLVGLEVEPAALAGELRTARDGA